MPSFSRCHSQQVSENFHSLRKGVTADGVDVVTAVMVAEAVVVLENGG